MMLMLNIFITVWCGRGSFALLKSTGTKPWFRVVFPSFDILKLPGWWIPSTCNTGTLLKTLTTKLKYNFLLKNNKKRKAENPRPAAFVFQPSPTKCPDLSEAWWSANYPRIARNYKLLKWKLLLLPVKQLVNLPYKVSNVNTTQAGLCCKGPFKTSPTTKVGIHSLESESKVSLQK